MSNDLDIFQGHWPVIWGFPGDSVVRIHLLMQEKCVPSLGQEDSPGGGNGNPLQYSCMGNPMDRGAWRATVQGFAKSQTL